MPDNVPTVQADNNYRNIAAKAWGAVFHLVEILYEATADGQEFDLECGYDVVDNKRTGRAFFNLVVHPKGTPKAADPPIESAHSFGEEAIPETSHQGPNNA